MDQSKKPQTEKEKLELLKLLEQYIEKVCNDALTEAKIVEIKSVLTEK